MRSSVKNPPITRQTKMAAVEKRLGKTLGASKGIKPAPKSSLSLRGTNPLKGKIALTKKWEF
jgi:hypothetical protein